MDYSIHDSVKEHVLIVGASSPMAMASAKLFAEMGVQVTLLGRKQPDSAHAFFECDLLKPKQIDDLYSSIEQQRGSISKLCFFQRYRGEEPSLENEFKVSIESTERFIENFRNQKDFPAERTVVLVSSPADSKIAVDQPLSYHLAKASLSQMVRYYANMLGPKRIRVNGVRPAIILKERARAFYEANLRLKHLYEQVIPLNRMGSIEDVAKAVGYFSSENSSYITGQIIDVDGGLSLHETGSIACKSALDISC